VYAARNLLPIEAIKLGVSMVQIIASVNSAYNIPWPSAFRRFLSLLRVFLVDVVAITQASCAQPMNYYASMMVVCVGLKLALAVLLLGPWLWSKMSARGCRVTRAVQAVQVRRKVTAVEASMIKAGHRRGSVMRAMLHTVAAAQVEVARVRWTEVFKASFMLLFVAYPGVSLKVLRLFKCREIEGVYWLAADMRLRCYDGRWAGFAIYGLVMAALYIVGLPAAVLWILWRRRHKLFGSPTDAFVASTRETFGFLYEDYGSSAWWWEVEELLRKLLLSAVVVLIDEGSPLQVTLAVLVSGWAHVLHAQYKPWGAGSVLYSLQHGALFVTSFVFLMGLLFKVDGVSSSSVTYSALSGIMVALCVAFMAAWVAVIAVRVTDMWRAARKARPSRTRGGRAGVSGAPASSSSAGVAVSRGVPSASSTDGFFIVTNPLRSVAVDGVAAKVDDGSDKHDCRDAAQRGESDGIGGGGAAAGGVAGAAAGSAGSAAAAGAAAGGGGAGSGVAAGGGGPGATAAGSGVGSGDGSGGDGSGVRGLPDSQRHPESVFVSRLRRVLTSHRPIQASNRTGSRGGASKRGSSD
jgi:hypothetical protein